MRSREKSLFLRREREVWGLAAELPRLQEEVASLQTKEREAHQHADEAKDKLKVVVAKAEEDAMELERLLPALDLARRTLENELKSNKEAKGLAAALAGDVGMVQREKTVLEEQVKGVAMVTFLLDVCNRFSDAL